MYRIVYYPPQGHGLDPRNAPRIHGRQTDTIAEAASFIEMVTGGNYGQWDEGETPGLVTCYHESLEDCCGGYAIIDEEREAKEKTQC